MSTRAVAGAEPQLSRSDARALLDRSRAFRAAAGSLLEEVDKRESRARYAYVRARDEVVSSQLREMPLARLKETTAGGVRFGVLEGAGFRTIGQLLSASPSRLFNIRGVGEHTVQQVVAAARQLELAMQEQARLRIEVDRRPKEQTQLLEALAAHQVAVRAVEPLRGRVGPLATELEGLEKKANRLTQPLRMFFSGAKKKDEARKAALALKTRLESATASELDEQVDAAVAELQSKVKPKKPWVDYEARVAEYNGLLVEVGGLAPDETAVEGFIPTDLAARVHKHPLDTELLTVSLRGYQAFGAKFALVQKRAVLGDEMGLGKTVEALAAISHLRAKGGKQFLVVAPASVLVNWLHETRRHTELDAFRLHGEARDHNLDLWLRRDGIGVTTFGHLEWLERREPDVRPELLVVDEAHYAKNPNARRTRYVSEWISRSKRTLFLTGTPMENRVDEFRTLIAHLDPKVATSVHALDGLVGAARFRSAVAPVYLRRNQEDVLQELPPRIETEEWVVFGAQDLAAYRDAVSAGSFMAMRQAAYAPGSKEGSAKLARLVEIAEEALSNGRKVVVYSFFRSVLDTVFTALGDDAWGPITGSVAPTKRQQLVDSFSESSSPGVLVSQIEAGGVGLNIQAASVVILAEPQWKPSVEDQAIARCHRMGQARPVDVHRLLSEDGVDKRMLEVLATKAALFDEYVRRSALKEATPDAIDVSDLQQTRQSASVLEEERRIIEVERRRLGLPTQAEGQEAQA